LITAGLAEPINSRIEQEYNSRLAGSDFGNNSIPTAYMEMFGPPTRPDYLQTSLDLGGPEDEPQGLFAEGGYIGGIAGGMDDTIPASIDGSQPAALSSGEFVVPADVVSHLGDGNNQNGAAKLYNFMDQVRTVKTGSTEQPDPFNDGGRGLLASPLWSVKLFRVCSLFMTKAQDLSLVKPEVLLPRLPGWGLILPCSPIKPEGT
jgi:hypothetical protein